MFSHEKNPWHAPATRERQLYASNWTRNYTNVRREFTRVAVYRTRTSERSIYRKHANRSAP